jgi:hypothetical protein
MAHCQAPATVLWVIVLRIIVLPIAAESNRLIIKLYVFNALDILLTKVIDQTVRIGPILVDNSL